VIQTGLTRGRRCQSLPGLVGEVVLRWSPLLTLMVAGIGIPTLVVTRVLAQFLEPRTSDGAFPTISMAAAFPPGSDVFMVGMVPVAVCAMIMWLTVVQIFRPRIMVWAGSARERNWLWAGVMTAVLLGVAAAIFLTMLAVITVSVDRPLHVLLSELFFASQTFALLVDTLVALRLRYLVRLATGTSLDLHGKPRLIAVIIPLALFFLFMHVVGGTGVFESWVLERILYTGSEMLICVLFFMYSAFYFFETRDFCKTRFSGHQASPCLNPACASQVET